MRRLRSPQRGSLRPFLALLLVVPLLVGSAGAPTRSSGDDLADAYARQKQIERQIAEGKAAIAELKAAQARTATAIAASDEALQGINADLGAVKVRISDATTALAEATARYEAVVARVDALETELVRLGDEQVSKGRELRERQDLLASRLDAAYRTGRTSLLEQLLTAGSLDDVLVAVTYYLAIGEQDRALARQIVEDRETLAALEWSVRMTRDDLVETRREALVQKNELERQRTSLLAAQKKLEKLERQTEALRAQQAAQYQKLASDSAKAAELLKKEQQALDSIKATIDRLVREQRSGGKIPSEYNGTLRWPMAGMVTQEFGCTGFAWEPPLGNCAHFHRGIDIAAAMYTPVKAAGPGLVVYVGPYGFFPQAWIVVIAHSERLLTWYGHLDNYRHPPVVRRGDSVSAGQVIAYEGMTGHTTGPHLHWMVELDGSFTNPRLFL